MVLKMGLYMGFNTFRVPTTTVILVILVLLCNTDEKNYEMIANFPSKQTNAQS